MLALFHRLRSATSRERWTHLTCMLLLACAKPVEPPTGSATHTVTAVAVSTAQDAGGDAATPPSDGASEALVRPAYFPSTDLHVDLGWQIHTKHASLLDAKRQASLTALGDGHVGTLVVAMFVENAHSPPPAAVRAEYNNTLRDLQLAFARDGHNLLGEPFAAETPGKIRVRISFEGADGFADAPQEALRWLGRGACVWGLVHSHNNALGGGSQDPSGSNQGLTATGKSLATTLAKSGGVLDIAHAADSTANELLTIAEHEGSPAVSTHTGMRALYNIRRNLPDDQIRRIAATGGIVGISFYLGHLTPNKQATLEDVVAHIVHLRDVGGAQVLALGSDFEGGIVPPVDAPTIAALPLLVAKLRARGFSERELEGFFHSNADRVFARAEQRGCGTHK
jgi:membrane dipeptidase